mmetsp:Transcript_20429/g.34580  ORF Transcript_20429/g.34580 Transcript_20429/m.34580 type:complete len:132 (+) Transcript_20429:294-689(+)
MDARGWSISNTRLNLILHWVSIGYANIVSITSFSSFTSQPPCFSVPHQIFACACLWLNHTRTPLSIIDYLIRATAASRLFIQAIISPRSNHARDNDTLPQLSDLACSFMLTHNSSWSQRQYGGSTLHYQTH